MDTGQKMVPGPHSCGTCCWGCVVDGDENLTAPHITRGVHQGHQDTHQTNNTNIHTALDITQKERVGVGVAQAPSSAPCPTTHTNASLTAIRFAQCKTPIHGIPASVGVLTTRKSTNNTFTHNMMPQSAHANSNRATRKCPLTICVGTWK